MGISTSILWQWNVMHPWACLYGKGAISNDNIIINLQTTTENTFVQICIYQLTMGISTSILWQWNVMRLWASLYGKSAISNDNIIIIIIIIIITIIIISTSIIIIIISTLFMYTIGKYKLLWCPFKLFWYRSMFYHVSSVYVGHILPSTGQN